MHVQNFGHFWSPFYQRAGRAVAPERRELDAMLHLRDFTAYLPHLHPSSGPMPGERWQVAPPQGSQHQSLLRGRSGSETCCCRTACDLQATPMRDGGVEGWAPGSCPLRPVADHSRPGINQVVAAVCRYDVYGIAKTAGYGTVPLVRQAADGNERGDGMRGSTWIWCAVPVCP